MTPGRFPPPCSVEQIPGGYVVKDANGQSLADVSARQFRPVTPLVVPPLAQNEAFAAAVTHHLVR
jgi:hypothetical protein